MSSRMVGPLHLSVAEPPAGAPAARPNVLCLHGLFAAGWVFDELLPLVAARGHSAAALSFRGHAPSAPVSTLGALSIADYVADATTVSATMDRPVVVGHSLGGLVALLLAQAGLVRAALLVAPAPPRWISVLSPPLLARMGRYLPALLLSRAFRPRDDDLDALVLNRVPANERSALRARLAPDSGRAAREAALGAFDVPRGSVDVPMLCVGGDADQFIPIGVTTKVAKRFGAPLVVARGHGHFLFAEPGREAVIGEMLAWLDGVR
jgi:pimeloyl-ACP methyl ester carboxylesterase